MMTEWQGIGLLPVYLLSVGWIIFLLWRDFQRFRFNFHLFFSLLYLLTFYFGFPFTLLLAFQFGVQSVAADYLLQGLLSATAFYAIYYLSYKTRWLPQRSSSVLARLSMTRLECGLMMFFLAAVAVATAGVFFVNNGFLLFKLHGYNQIFSAAVSDVALKRFFYFFIPAMLLFYFIRENKRAWWWFLFTTCLFGLFTYLIVGGTRANILIAFALFLFIGLINNWISLSKLLIAGLLAIVVMFYLALHRYSLQVNGAQAFYTFLYLTRDTFSPWENFAKILAHYSQIEFQGLAPMVRDFYVFIPNGLWPDRPHIILNTANYFTWDVLQNRSGLAMSPTLLGSLVIMGGWWFLPLGAVLVGGVIKGFDHLYGWACHARQQALYASALLKTYCFGAVFNVIVLVREGLDAFGSRLVFFSVVFLCCLLLSKLIYWLCCHAGLVKLSPAYR